MKKPLVSIFAVATCLLAFPRCGKNSEPSDVVLSQVKAQYTAIAPEKIGGPWQRKIYLTEAGAPMQNVFVHVKRFGEMDFSLLGYTDAYGVFVDTSVHQHSQYQFGGKLNSEWQTGLRDLVWSDTLTAQKIQADYESLNTSQYIEKSLGNPLKAPHTIQAERIFVPKNQVAAWRHLGDLTIIASQLEIQGELRAFALDCTGGFHAPKLEIIAKSVHGNGTLNWAGCQGATGATGTPGAPGSDGDEASGGNGGDGGAGGPGGNGGVGGNGGQVRIRAEWIDLKPRQMLAQEGAGGSAGAGGTGGAGGKYGYFGSNEFGERNRISRPRKGSPGKRGRDGSAGSAGSAGNAGLVKLITNNAVVSVGRD